MQQKNTKQLFGTENHIIILGDALQALQTTIKDNSIDLIFADPFYNMRIHINKYQRKLRTQAK